MRMSDWTDFFGDNISVYQISGAKRFILLTVDLIQNTKESLLNIPMQAGHWSKLLPIGWQFSKIK